MSRALLAAAVASFAASAAAAPFEGVINAKMTAAEHGIAGSGTIKMYVSAAGLRSEMEMSTPQGTLQMTALQLHGKPNVIYMLNDARKTYSEMERPKADKAAADKVTVKKLGNEKVAGYDCVHALVHAEKGGDSEVWVTSAIALGDDFWANQQSHGGNWGEVHRALKSAGVEGLPMRWTHGADGKQGSSWEVTSVEARAVPASEFDLSGYTKSESPLGAIGGLKLTPEQQKMLDEAMKRRANRAQ